MSCPRRLTRSILVQLPGLALVPAIILMSGCAQDPVSPSATVKPAAEMVTAAARSLSQVLDAGEIHTCALKTDGSVTCWGDNSTGQTAVPPGLVGVAAVSAGSRHTCALRTDGTVNCWGFEREAAVPAGLASVAAISADFRHSCALKTDGSVTCWGSNFRGETTVPAGLAGVAAISVGAFHTCALKTDGSVSCWGDDPGAANVVPTGLAGVAAVSAGGHHTCALKTDGAVICWGDNGSGQTSVPAGLTGVAAVSAGGAHTCALKTDASVSCWGDDAFGQTTVPAGLAGVVAVTAGFLHTCALKTDGSVSCWGDNRLGQTTIPVGLDLITEPGETTTGSGVLVQPVDPATNASPATLTFSIVTAPGQTTIAQSPTGSPPPTGFKLGTPPIYYEIATTASFSGSVELCISYDPEAFSRPERLRLFHDGGSGWQDITTSNDPAAGRACGVVTSLSPFALFEAEVVVTSWNAEENFSATSNPNGQWVSGWTPTLGSSFTRFSTPALLPGTLAAWQDPTITVLNAPLFARNVGTSPLAGIDPGETELHPGCQANEVAVLRWIAPAPGNYQVTGRFGAGDIGDMPGWVLKNGDAGHPLFSAPSTNGSPAFTLSTALVAGDFVDFAVGTGSGGCSFGSTVLSATISQAVLEQTITFGELENKTFGDPDFPVTATASSELAVGFTAEGKCTIADATVHLTGAGTCTITAHQVGNTSWSPAQDVSQEFQIAKAAATLALSDLSHAYDNTPQSAVVTVTPAGLSGVTIAYDGGSTPPTNAGSYAVEATLTHDDYQASPVRGTLTIAPATPVIQWTPLTPIFLGTALGGDELNAGASGVGGTRVAGTFAYTPGAESQLSAGAHQLSVQFTSADANYTGATGTAQIAVLYRFSGFFQPVDSAELNTVKAGRAIPLKFSLAGNQGLGIIQAGSPSSSVLSCGTTSAGDPIEDPVTTNSGLSYDPANDQYTYVWKTNSIWTGCRRLTLTLSDRTQHEARFYFAK
jgi:MBG domain/Regulator of chromosome condensation (RCC1) repeat